VLLAIAHGTTGSAARCAPSGPGYADADEVDWLRRGVQQGWAVAMTDYQGIGGPGRHPFLAGVVEGRNVVDAALAARRLPAGNVGRRTVITGYSEGGHGALWAAQVAPSWAPDMRVVATFAGAPATEIPAVLKALPAVDGLGPFGLMLAAGYQQAFGANPATILTPLGLSHLADVDAYCLGPLDDHLSGLPDSELFLKDVTETSGWPQLARENVPGQVKLAEPVLIIHSQQDDVVPIAFSATLLQRMCHAGTVVERRVLANGGDHGAGAATAFPAAIDWLNDQLAGKPAVNSCAAS
jgi:fermentation-respiration switch protein FrsA (DUF1100 family)